MSNKLTFGQQRARPSQNYRVRGQWRLRLSKARRYTATTHPLADAARAVPVTKRKVVQAEVACRARINRGAGMSTRGNLVPEFFGCGGMQPSELAISASRSLKQLPMCSVEIGSGIDGSGGPFCSLPPTADPLRFTIGSVTAPAIVAAKANGIRHGQFPPAPRTHPKAAPPPAEATT